MARKRTIGTASGEPPQPHPPTPPGASAAGTSLATGPRAHGTPQRWNAWRTSVWLFVLILVLGIVPVVLGGEMLGWWQATLAAPFIHPRALPF